MYHIRCVFCLFFRFAHLEYLSLNWKAPPFGVADYVIFDLEYQYDRSYIVRRKEQKHFLHYITERSGLDKKNPPFSENGGRGCMKLLLRKIVVYITTFGRAGCPTIGGILNDNLYFSNIPDNDLAEADIAVQEDNGIGVGVGMSLGVNRGKGGAGDRLYPVFPGDQDFQLTEGAVQVDGAVLRNLLTAA